MAQRRRIRLRPITAAERAVVERVARAGSASADRVARAKALLAVADGATFVGAARAVGRRSGMRWRTWSNGSTPKGPRRWTRGTAVGRPCGTARPSGSGSCASSAARRSDGRTGPPPGH